MKRIVRLTESDLARIVKRVINEGSEKAVLDAGWNRDSTKMAVAFGTPTASDGGVSSGIQGVKVVFDGLIYNASNKVTYEGKMAFYGRCDKNGNPGAMSGVDLNDVLSGGSYYLFGYNGKVDTVARNWCKTKTGVKPTGFVDSDFVSMAKEDMTKGLKRS